LWLWSWSCSQHHLKPFRIWLIKLINNNSYLKLGTGAEQGSKEQPNGEKPHVEEKVFSDEELVALIDPILQMDDTSRDGFIDYPEFIKAQQKAAEKMQHQQEQQPAQQQQQQQQQQPPH